MAETKDLSKLEHAYAQHLHLYYEKQKDGTNVLRHIRVHQRTYDVPSEGITIDTLPDDFIGTEHIKDGSVQAGDLSQQLRDGLVSATEKGAKDGIATLGSDGKVPNSQLPEHPVANESDVRSIVSDYTTE